MHLTKEKFMLLLKQLFCKHLHKLLLKMQIVVKRFLTEGHAFVLSGRSSRFILRPFTTYWENIANCAVFKNWFWLDQITEVNDSMRPLFFLFLWFFFFLKSRPFIYQFCCTHFIFFSTFSLFVCPNTCHLKYCNF